MKRLDSIILAVALVLTAATESAPKLAAQIPHPLVEVYSGPAGNDNYLSKLYIVEVFRRDLVALQLYLLLQSEEQGAVAPDSQNGFHNVAFQNLTISGKLVTSRNFRRYFDVNSYVSALSFIP